MHGIAYLSSLLFSVLNDLDLKNMEESSFFLAAILLAIFI